MANFSQNNFKDSNIAKEGKSSKVLVIATAIVTILAIAAFKHAIGN